MKSIQAFIKNGSNSNECRIFREKIITHQQKINEQIMIRRIALKKTRSVSSDRANTLNNNSGSKHVHNKLSSSVDLLAFYVKTSDSAY